MDRRACVLASFLVVACGSSASAGGAPADAAIDSSIDSSIDSTIAEADAADATTSLSMDLARGDGTIVATIHGALAAPVVTAIGGTVGPVTANAGDFQAIVTPTAIDAEVPITATVGAATITRTAIVLSTVDPSLDQPVAIDGLVNTDGVEDGANVSPDGQWLIVASYTPVDLYSCAADGVAYSAPSCSTIRGPVAAPARPNMLGASRIHGATYDDVCPSLGVTTPIAQALIPVAAYVFHRQADGSFAEPHVLGVDADGCLGPYGYSFAAPPNGTDASLVFAHDDPFDSPDTKADLYFLSITLGADNVWGRYSVVAGTPTLSAMKAVKLPPVLAARQGNPAFAANVLAWDDEDLAGPARDLFFVPTSGALPSVSAGDAGPIGDAEAPTLGVSQPNVEEIQPAFDGDDLYWFGDRAIVRATKTGADLAAQSSWSPRTVMLSPSSAATGTILATGEPTIAHVGGKKELYFVYIKRVAGGLDGAVGRVAFR